MTDMMNMLLRYFHETHKAVIRKQIEDLYSKYEDASIGEQAVNHFYFHYRKQLLQKQFIEHALCLPKTSLYKKDYLHALQVMGATMRYINKRKGVLTQEKMTPQEQLEKIVKELEIERDTYVWGSRDGQDTDNPKK